MRAGKHNLMTQQSRLQRRRWLISQPTTPKLDPA
jgi:hypothetical protein